MLLGEALEEISSLSKKFDSLRERARINAQYQEGEPPAEESVSLTHEAEGVLRQLQVMTQCVQRTNAATALREGYTLADALIERHTLTKLHSLYSTVADAASGTSRYGLGIRHTRSELKVQTSVPVEEFRAKSEELAASLRKINTMIQQANWKENLLD